MDNNASKRPAELRLPKIADKISITINYAERTEPKCASQAWIHRCMRPRCDLSLLASDEYSACDTTHLSCSRMASPANKMRGKHRKCASYGKIAGTVERVIFGRRARGQAPVSVSRYTAGNYSLIGDALGVRRKAQKNVNSLLHEMRKRRQTKRLACGGRTSKENRGEAVADASKHSIVVDVGKAPRKIPRFVEKLVRRAQARATAEARCEVKAKLEAKVTTETKTEEKDLAIQTNRAIADSGQHSSLLPRRERFNLSETANSQEDETMLSRKYA